MTRYSCAIGTIGTFTPASRADLGREHAARVDDDLGLDRALVGLDAGRRGRARRRSPVTRVFGRDLGAAAPRALGERERELARVDVAVGREVGRAEHAVGRHRREELLRLVGGDQLEREAERLRPAGLARELLHALLRRREPQRADLAPAGLEPDLVAERAVEVDRAHHHLRQAERAAQLADEPGRMEGRAARQVGPLDEDDVVPAEPGEPVEDRAAADAAADHDRTRPRTHPEQRKPSGCGRDRRLRRLQRRSPPRPALVLDDASRRPRPAASCGSASTSRPAGVRGGRREFGLHPLAVEDAVNAHQRPKVEVYDDTLFVVLKTVRYVEPEELVEIGELMSSSAGLRHHRPARRGQRPVRRARAARGAAGPAAMRPVAVLYAIADRVVDDYEPVADGVRGHRGGRGARSSPPSAPTRSSASTGSSARCSSSHRARARSRPALERAGRGPLPDIHAKLTHRTSATSPTTLSRVGEQVEGFDDAAHRRAQREPRPGHRAPERGHAQDLGLGGDRRRARRPSPASTG